MEKTIITFSANEQCLQKTSGIDCYASNTVAYIEARFDLGENWSGFDSVRAVWYNDYNKTVATVLDSDGTCVVPYEVLTRKSAVKVNLVGSIADGDVLTDRLTTCPVVALTIKCNAKTDGDNTQPITPSEYEQFVASVKTDADRAEAGATASANSAQSASESATASANSATSSAQSATASAQSAQNAQNSAISAENAKDDAEDARDEILGMRATAETLEAGSDATASYSDGLLTLGIPRGDKGEQGIQGETGATPNLTIGTVETLAPTEDATATITGTAENPVLNLGLPKGDTGEVSLEDLEALLPTETASGEIVTITDGQSIVPAKSLKVQLEPIQSGSGTPSPDNVRPISGHTEVVTQRTGKNLLNSVDPTMLNAYYNVATISTENINNRIVVVPCAPSTDYFFTWNRVAISGTQNARICTFESTPTYGATGTLKVANVAEGASASFTTGERDTYIAIYCGDVRATDVLASVNASMLGYGSTATAYEPYNGTTYTTALGRTVYGGTLDVVSGELVVTHGMYVMNGTESYTQTSTGLFRFTPTLTMASGRWYTDDGAISDTYHKAELTSGAADGEIVFGSGNNFIYVRDSRATTIAEFKELLADNNVTITYPLATTRTIQLTPQEVSLLLGTNNVWSDGEVTLTYSADIQRYIEKKLNGNSTTLTMSRPMVQTEEAETAETE